MQTSSEPGDRAAVVPVRTVPPPESGGLLFLEEALRQRRSVRAFTGQPLSDRDISQLLWAAQGVTHGGVHATSVWRGHSRRLAAS